MNSAFHLLVDSLLSHYRQERLKEGLCLVSSLLRARQTPLLSDSVYASENSTPTLYRLEWESPSIC